MRITCSSRQPREVPDYSCPSTSSGQRYACCLDMSVYTEALGQHSRDPRIGAFIYALSCTVAGWGECTVFCRLQRHRSTRGPRSVSVDMHSNSTFKHCTSCSKLVISDPRQAATRKPMHNYHITYQVSYLLFTFFFVPMQVHASDEALDRALRPFYLLPSPQQEKDKVP